MTNLTYYQIDFNYKGEDFTNFLLFFLKKKFPQYQYTQHFNLKNIIEVSNLQKDLDGNLCTILLDIKELRTIPYDILDIVESVNNIFFDKIDISTDNSIYKLKNDLETNLKINFFEKLESEIKRKYIKHKKKSILDIIEDAFCGIFISKAINSIIEYTYSEEDLSNLLYKYILLENLNELLKSIVLTEITYSENTVNKIINKFIEDKNKLIYFNTNFYENFNREDISFFPILSNIKNNMYTYFYISSFIPEGEFKSFLEKILDEYFDLILTIGENKNLFNEFNQIDTNISIILD